MYQLALFLVFFKRYFFFDSPSKFSTILSQRKNSKNLTPSAIMTILVEPSSPPAGPSSSLGNLFLLGCPDSVKSADSILKFVKDHDSSLNFPQKVSLPKFQF